MIPAPLAWNASPSGLTGVRVTRLGNRSGESRFKGEQEVVAYRAKVRRPGNLSDETVGQWEAVSYWAAWGSPVSFSGTLCLFAPSIISLY